MRKSAILNNLLNEIEITKVDDDSFKFDRKNIKDIPKTGSVIDGIGIEIEFYLDWRDAEEIGVSESDSRIDQGYVSEVRNEA